MAKLSPIFNEAQFISGIPASGAKLFTYVAGSSTKQTTYADEAGLIAQANPIVLDSRGEPTSPIWLTEGLSYKFVFTASTDTDPPTSPIRTIDNIEGINDSTTTIDQWVQSGLTPTFVSATQFTLPGDQTTEFHVNRRVKLLVTAGTVYGYISVSAFAALTTVTVVLDSGVVDSGLSNVQLGLITYTNTSLFPMQTANIANLAITNAKLANAYINDLTTVVLDPAADYLAIADGSDAGNKKKALIPSATDTLLGLIKLLTSAEYVTGTDTTRALTAAVARANNIVSGTAIATTSGTAHDFTIPAWAKQITLMLSGVSTNGTSVPLIQLGDSGGIEATGYLAGASGIAGTVASANYTTGFGISNTTTAADIQNGTIILTLLDAATNTWTASGTVARSNTAYNSVIAGSKALTGALTTVRLTTVNGTDAFDAGLINVIYQ